MKKIFIKLEELLDINNKLRLILTIISGISVIVSLIFSNLNINLIIDPSWVAIILSGLPIVLEAICGLIIRFDVKADVLVAIALIASLITKEYFAAGEVAVIMKLGEVLEELTVSKANKGLEKLVKLKPHTARRVINDLEETVDLKDISINEYIRVNPGEEIPVDGIIIEGFTSIDQSTLTGESLPVEKKINDEVFSGTINQYGSILVKVTKLEVDSSIQKMIKLVEEIDSSKAKIVTLADKWATWVVIIALVAAVLTFIFTKEIIRSVTILVVFCPCSLILATPTAIMAAIGNVTKHGFLVKNGDAIERLSKCNVITFDKTGTLTNGKLSVVEVKSISNKYKDNELYYYASSLEKYSTHPIGIAIYNSFNNSISNNINNFINIPGKGIKGFVDNKLILAGNIELLKDYNINITNSLDTNNIYSIIYISIDNEYVGYIKLSDTLKNNSKSIINSINKLGLKTILLTGDNLETARYISNLVNINEFKANCFPETKVNYIKELSIDNKVCMIGDGINDAPSLKQSYCGISMGKIGSDIAKDASDIILLNDNLDEVPYIIKLSKKMMKKIKFNLIFSMILNFVAIILAIVAVLNPVLGALVHNAGSVFVIINSALLLIYKSKNNLNK